MHTFKVFNSNSSKWDIINQTYTKAHLIKWLKMEYNLDNNKNKAVLRHRGTMAMLETDFSSDSK